MCVMLASMQNRQEVKFLFLKITQKVYLILCIVIMGPYKLSPTCRPHYFLTNVDDVSRAAWLYLMRDKSEIGGLLRSFISMTKTQFGK